jgi:hypothetical protein
VSYATVSAVSPIVLGLANDGGNSFTASASVQHTFGGRLSVQGGYERLSQNYDISVVSQTPNSNYEFVKLTYLFRKPLGL